MAGSRVLGLAVDALATLAEMYIVNGDRDRYRCRRVFGSVGLESTDCKSSWIRGIERAPGWERTETVVEASKAWS